MTRYRPSPLSQAVVLVLVVVVLLCLSFAAAGEMPHMAAVVFCCFTLAILAGVGLIKPPSLVSVAAPRPTFVRRFPSTPVGRARSPDPIVLGALLI